MRDTVREILCERYCERDTVREILCSVRDTV